MRKHSSVLLASLMIVISAPPIYADVFDVAVGPNGDFVFDPVDIEIALGDTVRWTWASDGHNVGSGLPGDPTPFFLSGPPEPTGTVFEIEFNQAFLQSNSEPSNLYDYHCHPHGDFGMVGSVKVITLRGDVNLDGSVNLLDVDPFVDALTNGTFQYEADTNEDGELDLLDVAPFVKLLSGG